MSQPVSTDVLNPSSGAANTGSTMSKEDIVDLLADSQEQEQEQGDGAPAEGDEEASGKKPAKPSKEAKPATEEESEESEEEIEDEEEPTEDELNFATPVRRQEILKKYPNIFKDFPHLQTAYYREQQFSEIYPTIDDAKEAQQKAQALDGFETDLMQGNFAKVLGAVKEGDPEAFNRLADNYLMELGKVDRGAVEHVVGNVIKNSIISVLRTAHEMGDSGEDLKNAAMMFHQAIFRTNQLQAPQPLAKQNTQDPEKARFNQEKQEFVRQKFNEAKDTLNTKVQNSIKATIANHIDPRTSMDDYTRRNAIRDAHEKLEMVMQQDKMFSRIMDKLWEKAFKDNFSSNSLDQIRSTYLSKAKSVMRSVINETRAEALKTSRGKVREERDRKGPLPMSGGHSSRVNSNSNHSAKSPKDIPRDMKTLDFLNSDD